MALRYLWNNLGSITDAGDADGDEEEADGEAESEAASEAERGLYRSGSSYDSSEASVSRSCGNEDANEGMDD